MSKKKEATGIKHNGEYIATKVKKKDLEDNFDEYYEDVCKLLGADRLKIESYDNDTVLMYDKKKNYNIGKSKHE